MNLRQLTDETLMTQTLSLVQREREILTEVLNYLGEINRRKLFAELGFKSLFEFAVKKLGYSEDQAYRRIAAVRLISEVPEVEEKISSGELTLTHIGVASQCFRAHQKQGARAISREGKLQIIAQISGKSVREAERIVLAQVEAPILARPDSIRVASESAIELRFLASAEVRKKVETLKGYLAHSEPHFSLGELFERLCDLGIESWRPSRVARAGGLRRRALPSGGSVRGKSAEASRVQVIRAKFQAAGDRCEKCGSSYALEVDHIRPRALGGNGEAENLRILCRNCNQRESVKIFGVFNSVRNQ